MSASHVIRDGRHDRARAISSSNNSPIISMTTQVLRETYRRFDEIARERKTTKAALIRQLVEACVAGADDA